MMFLGNCIIVYMFEISFQSSYDELFFLCCFSSGSYAANIQDSSASKAEGLLLGPILELNSIYAEYFKKKYSRQLETH